MKTQGLEVWRSRSHVRKPRQHWGNAQKTPTDKGWVFGKWWWGGTLRQTSVTQRLTTASNSCGKVRNPALVASNPTSSARPGSPAKSITQDASSIPLRGIEPTSGSGAWQPQSNRGPGLLLGRPYVVLDHRLGLCAQESK